MFFHGTFKNKRVKIEKLYTGKRVIHSPTFKKSSILLKNAKNTRCSGIWGKFKLFFSKIFKHFQAKSSTKIRVFQAKSTQSVSESVLAVLDIPIKDL